MRLRKRYVGKRIRGRSDHRSGAPNVDQDPLLSCGTDWSLADSLRLLEHHYSVDRDDQPIDLTVLDQEPEGPTLAPSAFAQPQ